MAKMKKSITMNARSGKTYESRPIAPTLRAMKIGDVEVFPIEQTNAIRTAPRQALITQTADGWKWATKVDYEKRSVTVTRVS